MRRIFSYIFAYHLHIGLLEDSWILTYSSAFILLQYVVLVEVDEENSASQETVIGKRRVYFNNVKDKMKFKTKLVEVFFYELEALRGPMRGNVLFGRFRGVWWKSQSVEELRQCLAGKCSTRVIFLEVERLSNWSSGIFFFSVLGWLQDFQRGRNWSVFRLRSSLWPAIFQSKWDWQNTVFIKYMVFLMADISQYL